MTEDEAHIIVDAVAALPSGKQLAFVLGMLEKVQEERDRLRAVVDEYQRADRALEDALEDPRVVEARPQAEAFRAAQEALLALDVSPNTGEGEPDGPPTDADPDRAGRASGAGGDVVDVEPRDVARDIGDA